MASRTSIGESHARSCAKCASGEGHKLAVLTVSDAGGRTRQLSLRGDQVGEVRRWLGNYRKLKAASKRFANSTMNCSTVT
jgi:hypothetical protein